MSQSDKPAVVPAIIVCALILIAWSGLYLQPEVPPEAKPWIMGSGILLCICILGATFSKKR